MKLPMRYLFIALACFFMLSGCGMFVISRHFEIDATGADLSVTQHKPSGCIGPGSRASFNIGGRHHVDIVTSEGPVYLQVYLSDSDSFQFTSKEIAVLKGWPLSSPKPEIGLLDFQYQPTEKLPTNRAYHSYFNANIVMGNEDQKLRPSSEFEDFEIKLPDAYYNGNLVSFPKMHFLYKKSFHYSELCLH